MADKPRTSRLGRRRFLKVSGAAIGGIAAGSSVVAAEATDRFIVKKRGNRPLDAEVLYDLSEIGYAVVKGSERALEQSSAVKSFAPDVSLEFDREMKAQALEESLDDSLLPYQWDKQDLKAPTAHATSTGDGARIAIIDSGIDASHPDLAPNFNADLSKDFTGDGLGAGVPGGGDHGTHVAGIAAAANDGTTGVLGMAPDAELVDFRVFSNYGGTNGAFSILVAALVEAARTNCDVANLSLGAYPIARQGLGSFYGAFLNSAMTYVNSAGTLLVVSAGNDGADLQHDNGEVVSLPNEDGEYEDVLLEGGAWISLPNEGAKALSVAATGPVGFGYKAFMGEDLEEPPQTPANYTNYGTNAVDLAAPGGNYEINEKYLAPIGGIPAYGWDLVFSTVPGGYGWKAGTSMAAPNVAGAAALVKSANPDYNADQVRAALTNAASVPAGYDKAFYGAGYLNVVDAL
jgi:subtilisin family serine protease